ncbi:DUF5343 domain-containing protein [Ruegeria arenilitoris]|uniref:DUF5343 domain-containing protein n=1 Tax=Ruegeria arenilitoris TaxID=1173585 RepID=UPI00147E97E3|nr:DUF5343 domain-containing protein [Ruegeria arenilitoris]
MSTLPYVTASGNIAKAIAGIKKAAAPERVSGDFVKTILGIKGGSGDQINSFLKKIGLADSSGAPTDLYRKLRNPTTSGVALAEAMRSAYKPLFDRNEHVYALNDDDLRGLIVEETGLAHDSNPVKMIFNSFKALNSDAEFGVSVLSEVVEDRDEPSPKAPPQTNIQRELGGGSPRLNIGYNIHLNLPATDDIAVFNAIFKSLRENLLTDDE